MYKVLSAFESLPSWVPALCFWSGIVLAGAGWFAREANTTKEKEETRVEIEETRVEIEELEARNKALEARFLQQDRIDALPVDVEWKVMQIEQ